MSLVPSHYLYVSDQNVSLAALLSVEEEILVQDYDRLVTYYHNHSMTKCLGFIQAIIKQDVTTAIAVNLMEVDKRFTINLDRFARYGGTYINSISNLGLPECVISHIVIEHISISTSMNVPHYLKKEYFVSYPSIYSIL